MRAACIVNTSRPSKQLATKCSSESRHPRFLQGTTYSADDVLRDDLVVQTLQQHMIQGLHMTKQSALCQPGPLYDLMPDDCVEDAHASQKDHERQYTCSADNRT